MNVMPTKSQGFTFIELLVTVSLIGILAGVVLAVLNPQGVRDKTSDSIRAGNVAKLAQSLEAYYSAANRYPDNLSDFQASSYVQKWPTDATYEYYYSSTSMVACVSVPMATNAAKNFVYITTYSSGASSGALCTHAGGAATDGPSCAGKVLKNCTAPCSDPDLYTNYWASLSGCSIVQ